MPDKKQRHGCLTTLLIVMITVNLFIVIFYLFSNVILKQTPASTLGWQLSLRTLFGAIDIVFLIAIFYWKKWGFWGTCIVTAVIFVLNLANGEDIILSFLGVMGLATLYGVLHIGGENKGWHQLN